MTISIHAPAKGATASRKTSCSDTVDFNPRSREGSDCSGRPCDKSRGDFNPRSREGSDEGSNAAGKTPDRFQSTLPRRERQRATITKHRIRRISIHAPAKGATRAGGDTSGGDAISIHAPAKGATSHRTGMWMQQSNFNPRSREGSDRSIICYTS